MEHTYRGYRVVPLGTFPMVKVQPPGSGHIPDDLKGVYTTRMLAERAIDASLNKLKGKGRKKANDKDNRTPTS